MTTSVSGTSMPLALTSVLTNTLTSPARNWDMAANRVCWALLEWISATWRGMVSSKATRTRLASSLVRTNNSARESGWASVNQCSTALIFVCTLGARTTYCSTEATGVPSGVTSMRVGHRRNSSANRSTRWGNVALKSRFCRLRGMTSSMSRSWGMKPMSIMRSASSSTMECNFLVTSAPFKYSSMNRPGVATTTSVPASSSAICVLGPTPPTKAKARMSVCMANDSTAPWTCNASSLVGTKMATLGAPS